MKVKVYFDNENERYKIYNGDTVINATEVTINEIPIDSELSDTSANAVENKAVKTALDNTNQRLNKANQEINTVNSRVSNLINMIGDYTAITPEDLAPYTWLAGGESGIAIVGYSADFELPPNSLVGIFLPTVGTLGCRVYIEHKTDNGYVVDYRLGDINTTGVDQFLVFNTKEYTTNIYRIGIGLTDNIGTYKDKIESDTTLYSYGIIDEVKDIRVDALGFTHASAGDSVRSIMEAIQTGKVSIDKLINWTEQTGTSYTGSAKVEGQYLPLNTDINITLPDHTAITFLQGSYPTSLGSITAEDTQDVVYNTGNNYSTQSIYVNSNSLAYNDLIEAIKLYIDFNPYIDIDTAMDDTSENVVQNKVIKGYVDAGLGEKQDTLEAGEYVEIDTDNKISVVGVANEIVDTANGSEIVINDSVAKPIKAISIMGKSTQNGTPTIDNPIPIVDITAEEIEVTNGTDTQTAELDITLRGIPVASGGNYTDNNGQEWICDSIEKYADGTGKLIQRVGYIDYSILSDITVSKSGTTNNNLYVFVISFSKAPRPEANIGVSNYAIYDTRVYSNNIRSGFDVTNINTTNQTWNIRLGFGLDGISTLNAFNEWLSNHQDLIFIYKLYEPIETPLTAQQLEELDLDAYYPTTNINSNTDVEVEYICDTKHYIDKKLAGA